MPKNGLYFCSKTERDLQKFSEEKKMTGFQQRAWLSNDKKERKTVQWDEISIQLAFLYFQTKFYISQYMYWGLWIWSIKTPIVLSKAFPESWKWKRGQGAQSFLTLSFFVTIWLRFRNQCVETIFLAYLDLPILAFYSIVLLRTSYFRIPFCFWMLYKYFGIIHRRRGE